MRLNQLVIMHLYTGDIYFSYKHIVYIFQRQSLIGCIGKVRIDFWKYDIIIKGKILLKKFGYA